MRVLAQAGARTPSETSPRSRPRALLAEQVGEPQSQLAGGADAERHREDLATAARCSAGEQVRDPVGQGPGLSGTRARDQQQRTGAVRYGLRLLGREIGEQAGPGGACSRRTGSGCGIPSPPSVSRWLISRYARVSESRPTKSRLGTAWTPRWR